MNPRLQIAIFRALQLGDMLCIIPAVRAIRTHFPNAHITLIGLPWQKDFAIRFPDYFNSFIHFPGWPGLPEQSPEEKEVLNFLSDVRGRAFDMLFQLHGDGSISNSMCMLWGAKAVYGLKPPGSKYDDQYFAEADQSRHEILRFVDVLARVGIKMTDTQLEFPLLISEVDKGEQIREQLHLRKRYIAIHPGARDPRRRWPLNNFTALIKLIQEQYDEIKILLTGSEEEKEILDALSRENREVINLVSQFGTTTVGEMAAVIAGAELLICNDTGVSHLAAALKIKSVVLFSGWSDPIRWAPLDAQLHRAVPPGTTVAGTMEVVQMQMNYSKSSTKTQTGRYLS